ncbi:MAG: dephospho-CoA kinase [Desulfurivibrionaceae bacterium]
MVSSQFKNRVRIIGLTGGIASGKSRAARFLVWRFGPLFHSADKTAHDLLEPGREGWRLIRGISPDFIYPDGTVNKVFLRSALFEDEGLRSKVNGELHPLVWQALEKKIKDQSSFTEQVSVLVEVPLLYEAGWEDRFDRVIVVFARRKSCLVRLVSRDNVSGPQAERELTVQMPLPDKCLLADHVVDNSGTWTRTLPELLHLGNILWPPGQTS